MHTTTGMGSSTMLANQSPSLVSEAGGSLSRRTLRRVASLFVGEVPAFSVLGIEAGWPPTPRVRPPYLVVRAFEDGVDESARSVIHLIESGPAQMVLPGESLVGLAPHCWRLGELLGNVVCATEAEGLSDCGAQLVRLHAARRGDDGYVGKVPDTGVGPRARHRVGVEFLGDVGFYRVHAHRWWRDTSKAQRVVGDDDLGLTEDRIAERDVDAEGTAVDLACEAALGTESPALVLHALVLDVGVAIVWTDGEDHEVAQAVPGSGSESV